MFNKFIFFFLLLNSTPFVTAANCFNCTDCVKCTSVHELPSGLLQVTLSAAGCHGGDDVSWMCCTKSDGTGYGCDIGAGGCDGSLSAGGTYDVCNEAKIVVFEVPGDTDEMTVQVHAGNFNGDVACSLSHPCCTPGIGGSSSCGTSHVCEMKIDLDSCPQSTPQCSKDSDCPTPTDKCAKAVCIYGVCDVAYPPPPTSAGCFDITNVIASTTFNGDICSSAAVTIGASAIVNGNILAEEAITLGASSVIHGNLNAGAAITLGAQSTVYGSATSAISVITYGDGAVVKG